MQRTLHAHRPPDLLTDRQWHAIAGRLQLSPREAEVVRLALYDDSVTVIAKGLNVSEHTVHTYRERVFRKLGVHSLCQVVSVVFAAHLVLTQHEAMWNWSAQRVAPEGVAPSGDTGVSDLTVKRAPP